MQCINVGHGMELGLHEIQGRRFSPPLLLRYVCVCLRPRNPIPSLLIPNLSISAGENGSETARWATAAGMKDFKTFYQRCKTALSKGNGFQWPDGIDEVDVGFGDPLQKNHPSDSGDGD